MLTVTHLVYEFSAFIELSGSLPCFLKLVPEPVEFSPKSSYAILQNPF